MIRSPVVHSFEKTVLDRERANESDRIRSKGKERSGGPPAGRKALVPELLLAFVGCFQSARSGRQSPGGRRLTRLAGGGD
jgi:hypothetical protein